MYYKHNDYEILHEIREGNEEALRLMFAKYKNLISKKIGHFNLGYEYDDMLQEGYMILYRSITSFNPDEGKTFTRYVDLNLDRKFISIVTKRVRRNEIFQNNKLYIFENNHNRATSSVYYELYKKEIAKLLTKREYLVYTLRELQNYSITYISDKLAIPDKTIYNSLHRAKWKIKRHFQNDLDKEV